MILQLFKKTKELDFERTYRAPLATVWQAWTDPDMLRQWWGPEKTFIPECRVDLRVGGELYLVMEAGEAMGKYAGTRWPDSHGLEAARGRLQRRVLSAPFLFVVQHSDGDCRLSTVGYSTSGSF